MGGARHGEVLGRYKEFHKGYTYESCEYVLQGGRTWEPDREKRSTSWRGRWKLYAALVSIFFSLCVLPSEALAYVDYNEMGISWGPNVVKIVENNVRQYGVVVVTDNIYNAALITLGYSPLDSRLTHDVMANLSNASTGGAFYTFAQLVHKYYNGSVYDYPGWGNWGTLDVQANVYGKEYIYWVQYTSAQAASAKEDLQTILNGGSLGGGSSTTFPAGYYYVLDISTPNYKSPYPSDFKGKHFYMHVDSYNAYKSFVDARYSSFGLKMYLDIRRDAQWGDPSWRVIWSHNISVNANDNYRETVTRELNLARRIVWDSSGENLVCFMEGSTVTVNAWLTGTNTASNSLSPTYYVNIIDSSLPTVYLDPNQSNWPESDPVEAPQPPELPEPQDPVTDPQPDPPTPQPNPTFPIYVDVSTTSYTADLQGILDAMNDHCMHLQNALHTNFSDFWTSLSTKMTNDYADLRQLLHGQFGWVGETIQDEMSETRDYLKELFEWLADQFDYSISGGAYNDNTVVSWLKKIYGKLGTGVNSRPADPVADPEQTGSWLDTLINNLMTALNDIFPGLINQVREFFGGALGNLTSKFPFSIPWDVAAILGLLVAEPVAPSVEIPAYTITVEGLTQAGSYDIDLSAYDAAWGAVRIMMRIAFALYICVHTKDFLDVIERVMM